MARTKMVDGVRIPFTAEEEAARDAEEAQWEAGKFDRAMANLRADRNSRLAITDFYGLSDVPPMSAAMTQYRQDLRDITANLTTVEDVNNVVWPTEPLS
tara:strand:- start:1814 stop:2110 length:297 start_codon:yes stop_codon:yes gene_type:complete